MWLTFAHATASGGHLRIRNLLEARRLHTTIQKQNALLEEMVFARTRELQVALAAVGAGLAVEGVFTFPGHGYVMYGVMYVAMPMPSRIGTTRSASLSPTNEVDAMREARYPCTKKWTIPTVAAPASTDPIRAAITPSRMNGVWMKRFDAPTNRMMPSSRRRLKALRRMVVAINSTAATSISDAIPIAVKLAAFNALKIGSRYLR